MLQLFMTMMVMFVVIPMIGGYTVGTKMIRGRFGHQNGLQYAILFGFVSIVLLENYSHTNTVSDNLGRETHVS